MKTKRNLDMVNGSIWNKLPIFALPVAATGMLEQLFNASDIAIVGNFAAEAERNIAVAAVGANTSVIGLVLNLFIGISLGANVVIANAIGGNDKNAVKKAVHTSIFLSLVGGIIIALLGEIFAVKLLGSLNVPVDVLPSAALYLKIYMLGMPVILLYNFEAAIFRSIGETKTPLIALAISGVLNIILNLFFVIVLDMSVEGVAIATVISNAVSSIILLRLLMKSDQCIKVELKELKIDKATLKKILKIGLPAGIQSALFSVSNIIIQSAVNTLGTVVMAASSAAFNVEIFAYYVFNSFSQACTTFVGQNYGAGKIERCKKTLYLSLIEDAIATVSAILLVLFSGKFLLSLFSSDPKVIEIGYMRLIIIFIAYGFSMLYEVMSGYMRGFGFSLIPAIITMIGVCGTRITWIYTVFPKNRTFETIMISYPISLAVTALFIFIALIIYRPSKRVLKS